MRAKCRESGMELAPVLLARREFEAVQEFRRDALPGQETYSEPVVNAVFKLLAMMATSKTDSGSTEMSDSESESPEDSASTQEC
jgi:hypothetical protein